MLGVDKDMSAKEEFDDAVARAYANRLRIENDAIRARQKAMDTTDNIIDIITIGGVILLLIWLIGLFAKM